MDGAERITKCAVLNADFTPATRDTKRGKCPLPAPNVTDAVPMFQCRFNVPMPSIIIIGDRPFSHRLLFHYSFMIFVIDISFSLYRSLCLRELPSPVSCQKVITGFYVRIYDMSVVFSS